MSKYISHNGEIKLANDAVVTVDNRAFNYGDGIFETIRCLNSEPLFFQLHFKRLVESLSVLKMKLSEEYTEAYFRLQISKLLQKNRIYKGARIRLSVFRKAGGLYTPLENTAEFIMQVSAIENEKFTLSPKGLNVAVYTENKKPINSYSHIKASNALFYVMAGLWKKDQSVDDCLILNQEGKIIEGLSSNIFLVKKSKLYSTSNTCGCIDGTMRKTVIKLALDNNMDVFEKDGFTEKDLLDSDEIFLTNAIQGISFVSAFKDRRYYHATASLLLKKVNELLS